MKKNDLRTVCVVIIGVVVPNMVWSGPPMTKPKEAVTQENDWKKKPDPFWRQKLSPEAYKVCRQAGTERAFSGKYANHHEKGIYRCVGCGLELFKSDDKFESGTGWPSFFEVFKPGAVTLHEDRSLFFQSRVEVRCARCDSHLGHVFDDGPKPTGKRYCMNSVCLDFVANDESGKKPHSK